MDARKMYFFWNKMPFIANSPLLGGFQPFQSQNNLLDDSSKCIGYFRRIFIFFIFLPKNRIF